MESLYRYLKIIKYYFVLQAPEKLRCTLPTTWSFLSGTRKLLVHALGFQNIRNCTYSGVYMFEKHCRQVKLQFDLFAALFEHEYVYVHVDVHIGMEYWSKSDFWPVVPLNGNGARRNNAKPRRACRFRCSVKRWMHIIHFKCSHRIVLLALKRVHSLPITPQISSLRCFTTARAVLSPGIAWPKHGGWYLGTSVRISLTPVP